MVLPPAAERAAMGGRIRADRQAADYGHAAGHEVTGQGLGNQPSVGGRPPGADDGDGVHVAGLEVAAHEEERGRVVDVPEIGGILGAADAHQPDAEFGDLPLRGLEVPLARPPPAAPTRTG